MSKQDGLGAAKGDLRPSKASVGATKDRLGAGKSALRPAKSKGGVGSEAGRLADLKRKNDEKKVGTKKKRV